MKIAIQHTEGGFSSEWIDYCKENQIPYKLVNCYDSDIVEDVAECDALMWHFHQANCKDILFAKQLMYSLQTSGKVVFPDHHTAWHFDDKVGQRYLLESLGLSLVPSYIFYSKEEAMDWIKQVDFPKVFKLRRGAGSSQVRLVENYRSAKKIVNKAFGKGFSQYDAGPNLKERWRKYSKGLNGFLDVMKGVIRFGYTTDFDRVAGKEKGYVYFQDFVPKNDSDTRVIVIDGKAFAIKRIVRKNDFRASGSGQIEYGRENFDNKTVSLAFQIADKLKSQCVALDFVYNNGNPLLVEISYGFFKGAYKECEGYWDRGLKWFEGPFNPQAWMVQRVIKEIEQKRLSSHPV